MIVDPNEDTLTAGSEAAAFYSQLGLAVARWGEIEDFVFELFTFAMDADRYKCAIVFSKMGTMDKLLTTVNEILEISLEKEWFERWHRISVELKTLVEFRNNLAHNPVGKRAWGSTAGQSGFQYYSHLGARKEHKTANWTASIDDIKAYNEKLKAMRDSIVRLGIPASARKKPTMPTPPRFPYDLAPGGTKPKVPTKPKKGAERTKT